MSERRSVPARLLGVTADLSVAVDGASADVTTSGGRAVVDAPSVGDAYRLLRAARRARGLRSAFSRTDLTVEVRVRGETVAVIGPDAAPGPLSDVVAPGPVELRPRALLAGGFDRTR